MNLPALLSFVAQWGRLIAVVGPLAVGVLAFYIARRTHRAWLRVGVLSLAGIGVLFGGLAFAVLVKMAPILDLTIGRHPAVGQRLAVNFHEVAEDTPRSLDAYAGKVVLLNWWATWCEPCKRELPALERVSSELSGSGLVVLMLSDEEREVLLAHPAPGGPLRGYVDYDALPEVMKGVARVKPVNIFIDRQGVVRGVFIGERDEAFFKEQARKYL